eukprot:1161755-Pelagomonas_calceolata.AAC.10
MDAERQQQYAAIREQVRVCVTAEEKGQLLAGATAAAAASCCLRACVQLCVCKQGEWLSMRLCTWSACARQAPWCSSVLVMFLSAPSSFVFLGACDILKCTKLLGVFLPAAVLERQGRMHCPAFDLTLAPALNVACVNVESQPGI